MTKQEMTDKFDSLYNHMASSDNVRYMKTFGYVHKEMMKWMIENKPELAEEYISVLCSIKWRQYLAKKEAEGVVKGMIPAAPWDYDTWDRVMEELHLECEREGVFNRYALWVAMNQIYTDLGESIAHIMGMPLSDIPYDRMLPIVHEMAVRLLIDPDGKYDIRKYHLW